MCGVAGVFGYGADAPPVDERVLLAIRDAMVARGPDAAGLWIADDGRAGLAHRRLSIIDLSPAGAQPMTHGALRIGFNGEKYVGICKARHLPGELDAESRPASLKSVLQDTTRIAHVRCGDRGENDVPTPDSILLFGSRIRNVIH